MADHNFEAKLSDLGTFEACTRCGVVRDRTQVGTTYHQAWGEPALTTRPECKAPNQKQVSR